MGRVMGIEYFTAHEHNSDALQMEREIKRALKVDREEQSHTENILRALQGGDVKETSETKSAIIKWVSAIRSRFKGYVIRRSSRSKDGNGEFISGLAPVEDHSLGVNLYPAEYEKLEAMATGPQEKVSFLF